MARTKYYNPTTQQWEYADSNPLPTGENGDIIVNENGVWVAKPKWQMIYQPVEYIESDGNQYINTGVAPNQNGLKILAELEMPPVTAQSDFYLFGSTYLSTNVKACYSVGGYNGQYHAEYGLATPHFFTNTTFSGKTTITYDNGSIIITDGTTTETVDLSSQTHTTSSRPFYIFADANDNNQGVVCTQGKSAYKLYSFKLWVGSNAWDFIPVRNVITGEGGLYDLVNGKFYANAGTGTFLKGADV